MRTVLDEIYHQIKLLENELVVLKNYRNFSCRKIAIEEKLIFLHSIRRELELFLSNENSL